jgi:hypothetical protein
MPSSSQKNRRRSSNRKGAGGVSVITVNKPSEYNRLDQLIRQGPATLILVYSPSCPHCHTYMPLWKELQNTPDKQTNMATMEASVFEETPLSEKISVEGVPSVLYVDTKGAVSEVSDIRNAANMTQILKTGSNQGAIASLDSEDLMDLAASATPSAPSPSAPSPSAPTVPMVVPGETVMPNPLPVLPGTVSEQLKGGVRRRRQTRRHRQHGGNPWAAFLASAGPAAVLAGAYAALPARSSGLPAPTHSAKWRRIRARLTRKHRK